VAQPQAKLLVLEASAAVDGVAAAASVVRDISALKMRV